MKTLKGLVTLVAGFALAGIMASPSYAAPNLVITNPNQPAVDAGNQITYTITASLPLLPVAPNSEDNIEVFDTLPRDASGNLQVSYVRSTCVTPDGNTCLGPVQTLNLNSTCTAAGVPLLCCTGAGAGTCPGNDSTCTGPGVPLACCTGAGVGTCPDLTWTMPGKWHAGDTFSITVTVNVVSNLAPTIGISDVANAAGTTDPAGGTDIAATATSLTNVAAANLTISNAGACNPSGKEALGGVTAGPLVEICSPTTVSGGETIGYTFDVKNTGSLDATGVVIQDVLPSGLTFAATNTNANSLCTAAGAPYTCCTGSAAGTCNAPEVCWGPSSCVVGVPGNAHCAAIGGPPTCVAPGVCACAANADCGTGGVCFNGRCIACPSQSVQAGSFDTALAPPYVPMTWLVPEIPAGQAVTVNYQATLASATSTSVPLFNVATASDAAGHLAVGTSNLAGAPATPCLTATETAQVFPVDCMNSFCTGLGAPSACCIAAGIGTCGGPPNSFCTALHVPSACCTGAGAGTCGGPTNPICTAAGVPLACCTGSGTGTCGAARTSPVPDDTIVYGISASNGAGCPSPGMIEIQAPLPNNTTYSAAPNSICTAALVPLGCCTGPGAGTCTGCGPDPCYFDAQHNTVTYLPAALPAAEYFEVTVNPNTADGAVIQCMPGTFCTPANASVSTTTDGSTVAPIPPETVHLPILNVFKQVSPSVVDDGDSLAYSILVTNSGQNCAKGVQLTDALPAANLVAGTVVLSGACSAATPGVAVPGKITFGPFDLGVSGNQCVATYKMVVPGTAAVGTVLTNTAKASGNHSVIPVTSNTATATVETDLVGPSLTKTLTGCSCNPAVINNPAVCAPAAGGAGGTCANWASVPAPSTLTYTLQVTASPTGATNVQLTDNLPPTTVATFVDTDCPSLVPAPTPATYVDCWFGTMAPGTRASYNVELAVNGANSPGTPIINSATATDDASDSFNQALTVRDAVAVAVAAQASPAPALQLSVSPDPSQAKIGRWLSLEATVSNTGTAVAPGVVVTGQLGGGMRMSTVVKGLPRKACKVKALTGTFTCSVGDLTAGDNKTLTLAVIVLPTRSNAAKVNTTIESTLTAKSPTTGAMATASPSTTVLARR